MFNLVRISGKTFSYNLFQVHFDYELISRTKLKFQLNIGNNRSPPITTEKITSPLRSVIVGFDCTFHSSELINSQRYVSHSLSVSCIPRTVSLLELKTQLTFEKDDCTVISSLCHGDKEASLPS